MSKIRFTVLPAFALLLAVGACASPAAGAPVLPATQTVTVTKTVTDHRVEDACRRSATAENNAGQKSNAASELLIKAIERSGVNDYAGATTYMNEATDDIKAGTAFLHASLADATTCGTGH